MAHNAVPYLSPLTGCLQLQHTAVPSQPSGAAAPSLFPSRSTQPPALHYQQPHTVTPRGHEPPAQRAQALHVGLQALPLGKSSIPAAPCTWLPGAGRTRARMHTHTHVRVLTRVCIRAQPCTHTTHAHPSQPSALRCHASTPGQRWALSTSDKHTHTLPLPIWFLHAYF